MATPTVWQATGIRGVPLDVYGRLTAAKTTSSIASPLPKEGFLIKQEDVSSISMTSWANGVQVGTTQTPSKSTSVFDALQNTGLWLKIDQYGGNAHCQIPGSLLNVSGGPVKVNIAFTLSDGSLLEWIWGVDITQPS